MSQRAAILGVTLVALLLGYPRASAAGPPRAECRTCALPEPWTLQKSPKPDDRLQQEEGLPYVPNHLLVRFAPGTDETTKAELHARYGARLLYEIPALQVQVLEVPTEAMVSASAYASSPAVAYAEPDYLVTVYGWPDAGPRAPIRLPLGMLDTPGDPLFSQQWHHARVRSTVAWDYTHGSGIVIAIVDTGVNCSHPDLKNNCIAGRDFVNRDNDPSDDHGHGTHVAGVASAVTNNGIGVAGAGWSASIMPIKALGSNGNGGHATIADGIVWAADHGAHVVNMSLGGFYSSSTLRNAVSYAIGKGVSVISAVGNDNSSNPTYPTAYPGVIGVAATTQSDGRASFSNYGDTVDVAAPGVGILSTVMAGGYQAWSGTSMATPIVAGIAGLLKGQAPSRTPLQIETLLENSAQDLGSPGWDPLFGAGRVDAGRALEMGAATGETPVPSATRPPATVGLPTQTATPANDWVQQVEDLINRERFVAGLTPLYTNASLRAAAARHSGDMASVGFCGHGGSDGSAPFDRMRDAGYGAPYGEIVACGHTSPAAVVQAWMGSSAHRAIILCTTCTEIGAGYGRSATLFEHYWTVDFGSRTVSGPTPTIAWPNTPQPGTGTPVTPPSPTATRTPTPVGVPVEVVLTPACDRVGWVVSSQPSQNHFGDDDTYTGTWNSQLYHGAMQFDLEAIPAGTHLNYARLVLTGRTRQYLGQSGAWSAKILSTDLDAGFAGHGYTTIHNATVEWMLLPVLVPDDLDAGRANTFNFTDAQLQTLASRLAGSKKLSLRLDGPTTGEASNLFSWESGCGPESQGSGPQLVISYSTGTWTPEPTATESGSPSATLPPTEEATATEAPTEEGTATETPTATGTEAPTATSTESPTATPSPSATLPPPPTSPPDSGTLDLIPACTDVGWVMQGQGTNHFGDDSILAGFYYSRAYLGALQFDVSRVPSEAAILKAQLILTGQSTARLSKEGNGLWRVRLLKTSADSGWTTHNYAVLSAADTHSQVGSELRQTDLGVGVRNVFEFSQEQVWELEQRVRGSGKVSFRIDGPRSGLSNIAEWDSGCGLGDRWPPVLRIQYGPPGSGRPTPTEPIENLAKAIAIVDAVNRQRVTAGLDPLAMSEPLRRAAKTHNDDMIQNRFFGHIGSDGSTPDGRVAREGFRARLVGEAIAGGSGDAFAVVDAWMGRTQRDDVLNPQYTHIGAAYRYDRRTAYGHYWTVVFAEAEAVP